MSRYNVRGAMPLHIAATRGHVAVADLLLRAGADKNVTNGDGKTARAEALMSGHAELVRVLR